MVGILGGGIEHLPYNKQAHGSKPVCFIGGWLLTAYNAIVVEKEYANKGISNLIVNIFKLKIVLVFKKTL